MPIKLYFRTRNIQILRKGCYVELRNDFATFLNVTNS